MEPRASAIALMSQAIDAVRTLDTAMANRLLLQAVEADPTYEPAWLYLSDYVRTPGERRYCLERALAINPQSTSARMRLAKLGDVAPVMPSAPLDNAAAGPVGLVGPNAQTKLPLGIILVYVFVAVVVIVALVILGQRF